MADIAYLESEFQDLVQASLDVPVPPQQLVEMRRVFMAGAVCTLGILAHFECMEDLNTADGRVLAAVAAELERFSKSVERGEA